MNGKRNKIDLFFSRYYITVPELVEHGGVDEVDVNAREAVSSARKPALCRRVIHHHRRADLTYRRLAHSERIS